jgi:hypothetical protein
MVEPKHFLLVENVCVGREIISALQMSPASARRDTSKCSAAPGGPESSTLRSLLK